MKRKTITWLTAALLLQSVCFGQNNPLLKYIPADADMVMSLDIMRMAGKIPGETFRQSLIYQQLMKADGKLPVTAFLNDPSKTGIDLSTGIMLAIKIEEAGNEEEKQKPLVHIFGKLKDAAVFTSTIKDIIGENNEEVSIGTYGTDRVLYSKSGMTLGWNDDIFVLTSGYAKAIVNEMMDQYSFNSNDTIAIADSNPPKQFDITLLMEKLKKAQRDICFQLLAPKSQEDFKDNVIFTTIMNREGDIRIWGRGKSLNPLPEKLKSIAPFLQKLQAFSGRNTTAVVNFENGKIVARGYSHPEADIAAIYKKYPPPSQNMDLIRRLPKGTLLASLNLSLNQSMINELIDKTGFRAMADSLAKEIKKDMPVDINLASGVFKSDLMVAVVHSDIKNAAVKDGMLGFEVIVALPIADKVKFAKLKEAILPALQSFKEEKATQFEKMQPFLKHNDDLLVLSLSSETATAFLNNSGTGELPSWFPSYSSYPVIAQIDMQQVMKMVIGNKRIGHEQMEEDGTVKKEDQNPMKEQENKILGKFGKLIVYGGRYENEGISSNMEFHFGDPNENALKQFFEWIASMLENKEMAYDNDEVVVEDTARISPASITVPSFKDPEVQQFANEYAEYITEYITINKSGISDTVKLAMLTKKAESWASRSQSLGVKLSNDPEEAKKFSDWMVVVSKQIGLVTQEVILQDIKQEEQEVEPPPPPPPPAKPQKSKVKPKKYTPPVIKKDE